MYKRVVQLICCFRRWIKGTTPLELRTIETCDCNSAQFPYERSFQNRLQYQLSDEVWEGLVYSIKYIEGNMALILCINVTILAVDSARKLTVKCWNILNTKCKEVHIKLISLKVRLRRVCIMLIFTTYSLKV